MARAKLAKRFDLVAKALEERPYLVGDDFTAPTPTSSTCSPGRPPRASTSPGGPRFRHSSRALQQRPAVQAALAAEKR